MPSEISGSFRERTALRAWPLQLLLIVLLALAALMPLQAKADITSGLVGRWTFNGPDMVPNVRDISGLGNHGRLVNFAATTTVIGKLGQDLEWPIGGTNQNVNIPFSSTLNPAGDVSIALWVKPSVDYDTFSTIAYVFSSEAINSGYGVYIDSGSIDNLVFVTGDGSDRDFLLESNALDWNIGQWYHIAAVYHFASHSADFYVDGLLVNSDSTGSNTSMTPNSGTNSKIAEHFDDEVEGVLDDVRVYSRALTAGDVKQLYQSGQVLQKPANNLGLVGYWSFNEGTSTVATDFSGRGNTGTLNGNATWVNGKRGKALTLDGAADYVAASPPTTAFPVTICAWANLSPSVSSSKRVVSLGANDNTNMINLTFTPTLVSASVHSGSGSATRNSSTYADLRGVWRHLCGVYTSTTVEIFMNVVSDTGAGAHAIAPAGISEIKIGRTSGATNLDFDGQIDDVRIYNRALGTAEVAALAKTGAVKFTSSSVALQSGSTLGNGLVGHWTMDGPDVTTTVTDRSGSNNHGYFRGGATSSARAIGKLGQALYFDALSEQYVGVGSGASLDLDGNGGTMSVCAWINRADYADNSMTLISDMNAANDATQYTIDVSPSGALSMLWGFGGFVESYNQDSGFMANLEWYHVCVIRVSDSSVRMYVDGQSQTVTWSETERTIPSALQGTVSLGRPGDVEDEDGPYWFGRMDDVRIYNRVLTAAEVKQLYKLGAVVISQ